MNFQAKIFPLAMLWWTSVAVMAQQGVPHPIITPDPPAQNNRTTEPAASQAPSFVATPPAPAPFVAPPAPTQSPASDPAQAKPVQQMDSTYVIGPEDDINVNVWREPSFTGTLGVRPDGMVSIPLLGDLKASGFTPMQLSLDIAARLKKYVTDPLVTVTVLAVKSKRIYLAGEVGHPGPLPLSPDMTPLQAILSGGGLGTFANAKHIYILRKVNGKEQKIPFNYKQALKTGDMQGVTLLSGDTIVVP